MKKDVKKSPVKKSVSKVKPVKKVVPIKKNQKQAEEIFVDWNFSGDCSNCPHKCF